MEHRDRIHSLWDIVENDLGTRSLSVDLGLLDPKGLPSIPGNPVAPWNRATPIFPLVLRAPVTRTVSVAVFFVCAIRAARGASRNAKPNNANTTLILLSLRLVLVIFFLSFSFVTTNIHGRRGFSASSESSSAGMGGLPPIDYHLCACHVWVFV